MMAKEQRLIDAMDYVTQISKKVQPMLRIGCSTRKLYDTILGCIADAPTVDAVEVVRCEKCRYYFDGACANYKNRVATRVPDFGDNYKYVEELKVAKDHFCSYGERRNDGQPKRKAD